MSPLRQVLVEPNGARDPLNGSTRIVTSLIGLCLVVLLIAVGWMHFTTAEVDVRVPGRLQSSGADDGGGEHARQVHVQTSGVVENVYVAKGDSVRRKDRILKLDERDVRHKIEANESFHAGLQAEVTSLLHSKDLQRAHFLSRQRELKAELAAANEVFKADEYQRRLDLEAAEVAEQADARQLEREQGLVREGAIPEADFAETEREARLSAVVAKQLRWPLPQGHLRVLERQLDALGTAFQLDAERLAREINRLRGQLKTAELDLQDLRRFRQRLVVHSPLDGVVTEVTVYPSDHVRPGGLDIWIAHTGFEFEAEVPVREAPNLREGQLARIRLDAVDHRSRWVLEGVVKSIAPDSTLTDSDGSRIPVYTVRIAIPNPQQQLGDQLQYVRLGAAGSVEIITGERSVLCLLLDKAINLTRAD